MANAYAAPINVKIAGLGLGGCDITLNPSSQSSACQCIWGTLDYTFCAYTPSSTAALHLLEESSDQAESFAVAATASGCPTHTGMNLLCSDLKSIGGCYGESYSCQVSSSGLCDCSEVV